MTHPDAILARSRAVEDAIAGKYDNREATRESRAAYDARHAQLTRSIQELGGCIGTDEDVRRAEV